MTTFHINKGSIDINVDMYKIYQTEKLWAHTSHQLKLYFARNKYPRATQNQSKVMPISEYRFANSSVLVFVTVHLILQIHYTLFKSPLRNSTVHLCFSFIDYLPSLFCTLLSCKSRAHNISFTQ